MRATTTYVVLLLGLARIGVAQTPPDTVTGVLRLQQVIERYGPTIGDRIWPGFRPDTIPVLWVIPHRAKLLAEWRYDLPRGFQPLPGIPQAAWTDTQAVSLPSGRFISFMSVDSAQDASFLVGTAIHEAFHSFERASSREDRKFGRGENSMLIAEYPVFDVDNEAAFALEGHLLRSAYLATDVSTLRARVAEFLAVRERRHRALDSAMAEFETMAELHEGLAQYTLLRGVAELGTTAGELWRTGAGRLAVEETALLDSLITLSRRSVRRRFYATGSTQGLILDRLVGDRWKHQIMLDDVTLEQALRAAMRDAPARTTAQWDEWYRTEVNHRRPEAEAAVRTLENIRKDEAERILAQPGVTVTIESLVGRLNWCGFDPQNTLPVGDGRLMHTRFLRLCGSPGVSVDFDTPVVETREPASFAAVVPKTGLTLTSEGRDVRLMPGESRELPSLTIASPFLTLTARKVRVSRDASALRILVEQ
ncbi:MAG TPA: hypothetical protein VGP80_16625 [Gemmatimonadales bacterium]|jgi:hypothetical protein|nr:hypothetical protein [Gemmatimonadales bacterium]